ncbi:LAGLIDADG family homing endonuclease [Streptomyces sp. CC219B]|uniref:LAGLIDADG family homing endonuclease n=1 Tax=Streptomyces sp. CC219B TaxID=3044574 RepID=UPI0024A8D5D1|nr:LAGLIDADG family homing endonuclease [Streptomyces sp. CC219B]
MTNSPEQGLDAAARNEMCRVVALSGGAPAGGGLAEGTWVWMPDGTVAPVEHVVAERLPVLAYDKEWDLRAAKPGRPYPPRDSAIGELLPTRPTRWIDAGAQPVFAVRFASGRVTETTANHRWAVRRREGSRRPTWGATASLEPGCALPAPLAAAYFGSLGDEWDGWFVGSMLGDGNMTGRTPVWVGHDDGTLQQIRDYAAKHGCQVNVEDNGTWLRVRLVDPAWHRNALRDVLIVHQVWSLKGDGKRVANLPYSREFVCGLVAGLIDSDGSVGVRQVEFANISEALVRQLGDFLLRLGVQSSISSKKNNGSDRLLWRLRVADGRSAARLSEIVALRAEHKAAALVSLAAQTRASRRSATGSRGYPESIMWDRVVSIAPAGMKKTYCVEVRPSFLWVANGVVTGDCVFDM